MDINLYLEVRRQFNSYRHESPDCPPIIFDEFSIMATLHQFRSLSASVIALKQMISCATMSHRSDHLEILGLIDRHPDQTDLRKTFFSLTPYGEWVLDDLLELILDELEVYPCFPHVSKDELIAEVAKMGSLPMTADSLVLFCFASRNARSLPIVSIVKSTSLLQPTVSMAVLRLEQDGMLKRFEPELPGIRRPLRRNVGYTITSDGFQCGKELVAMVRDL